MLLESRALRKPACTVARISLTDTTGAAELLGSQIDSDHDFTRWSKVLAVAGLVVLIYWRVLFDLGEDWWTQPSLSQGFLIPPLAVYIVWIQRARILAEPALPAARGLVLSAAACFLFLLGKVGAEFFLLRISFVVLLAGITWTFWGRARFRLMLFPFLLLATMVPLPKIIYEKLSMPLQLLASSVATETARMVGVSVYREGNVITLANITLGVEEACSGLSSLSATVVGALLLGYLYCTRRRTRLALFALALPLCVAVNVFRVAGTAILADYNPRFALGFYHSLSGWLVFLVGFWMLWGSARILHKAMD